ncbi:DUF3566 domain-containing protein [Demequina sp. TTPB684]|uniref:DUF3566 domain-containing protein n=1 Tax=unclassified Demequina TaxID=2620311 RepID=UPI001CF36193|nr:MULTISPECIES: DUF3566 domain-containing protein [unclassified Demequina]MCB2412650.1 DUF3566 domain-containing protein [Demequina sp. TTPB684]UPU87935.1 DUF3566 domain-containing protein [Demequina sp. TMPB413]
MNADDRNPNNGGQPSAPPVSAQTPVRRAGVMPASGSVPQRTAFRPVTGTQPTGQPSTSQHSTTAPSRPASSYAPPGTAPAAPRQEGAPARPSYAPQTGTPQTGTPQTGTPHTGAPQSTEEDSHGVVGAAQDKVRSATAGLGRLTKSAKDKVTSSDDAKSGPVAPGAPRKVRVLLSRVDPWSALKIGFLLSIAAGIMLVVAVHVLWQTLNAMGTFDLMQEWVLKLFTQDQEVDILQFVAYQKVISATLLVAVTNVVLISGLSVIAAFLYNMVSRMVGGVYLTLTDD